MHLCIRTNKATNYSPALNRPIHSTDLAQILIIIAFNCFPIDLIRLSRVHLSRESITSWRACYCLSHKETEAGAVQIYKSVCLSNQIKSALISRRIYIH